MGVSSGQSASAAELGRTGFATAMGGGVTSGYSAAMGGEGHASPAGVLLADSPALPLALPPSVVTGEGG